MQRLVSIASIPVLLLAAASAPAAEPIEYDVVVYGATSGGVMAAVQAARLGKRAVLIEPGRHVGGLTSGGLGATDIGNKGAIGGLARDFYRRIHAHYAQHASWVHETPEQYQQQRKSKAIDPDTMWTFEPHVAEQVFLGFLREARIEVVFGERLDLAGGVEKQGPRIVALRMESGRRFPGRMFIDASYEGDVMAKAGVAYHVGRESNATYGETLNGVQLGSKKHQFHVQVDPYRTPGDATSGLLPGIHGDSPGRHGEGDHRVQAYNFRLCLTDVPENQRPFPKPAGYDPLRYELLIRTILAGQWDGLGNPVAMPNRKTDTNNNGAFSSDNIGMNYDYPDGDYATRQRVFDEHVQYQMGWLWFLANDPRVPEKIQAEVRRWGLAKDEFRETDGWPHQLYVREARRMISDLVMTEHHCQGDQTVDDAVGLAAYGMDSHNTQRYVLNGYASNEGDVQVHGFSPYGVGYRAIRPRAAECTNLLVPVCLSASHIAYGSIRMEPVFMVLGQSAATAAAMALDANCSVQEVDIAALQARLLSDGQIIEWTGPRPYRGPDPAKLPGIVVDDAAAEFVGDWSTSRTTPGFIGAGYSHDGDADKGKKTARFSVTLPASGRYEVRISYTALANRAANVPVAVQAAGSEHVVLVNQRHAPPIEGGFLSLGTYQFDAARPAVVEFRTAGTTGHVIVDAVQFLPAK